MKQSFYNSLLKEIEKGKKQLAILIDPDKFDISKTPTFLNKIPSPTSHLFVGGSTAKNEDTKFLMEALKEESDLPIFLFPGNYSQITDSADALLFLTLLSGRNPEYLIGQQVKSISKLRNSTLEIIPTGYILIDGGTESSVSKVTQTQPLSQDNIELIVNTALAGQYMGAKMIYLEAGSGANFPVKAAIISQVKSALRASQISRKIPLIVGGGIKNETQKQAAYNAGADMIVMGTAFET